MSYLSCNDEINRACADCPTDEPNRIIHAALVKKGTTFPFDWGTATPQQRYDNIIWAELNCKAIIFRNVNGTKADPTKAELPGKGRQTTATGNSTHTIAMQDHDYVINQANGFYNSLEKNAVLYNFYYFTTNYAWQVPTDSYLKIAAFDPITDDINTNIIGRIDITWTQAGNPIPYEIATDGLDTCPLLCNITPLYAYGTKDGFPDLDMYLTESGNVQILNGAYNGYQSVEIGFTNALSCWTLGNISSVALASGTLPTGINLVQLTPSVNLLNHILVLSGEFTAAGVFEFTLRISNSCGSVTQDIPCKFTIS